MTEKYLLTVAIPTYNGEATISNMLDRLLPQCDSRVQVLISDNASKDQTESVIQKYLEKYPFIKYVRNEKNIGPDSNFLQCMELAEGKYTWLLSDDDILMEGKLEIILEFLSCDEEISLVYLNAKGFHERYIDEEHCEFYQRAIYDHTSFVTIDKKKFMAYAGRMWGFLSCFVCLTEAFKSLSNVDCYKGTNWLQSYIHILCAEYGEKKLGVISEPCIGAGIYSIVSNFDSARVDGVTYREMLDFAIAHGFDRKQLDDLFIWRICFISKRSIVKEKASGVCRTNVKALIRCTKKYPYAWVMLYPYLLAPKWLCKIAVKVNKKKKYTETLHLNREGDVIG